VVAIPYQEHVISELVGMDRNSAEGTTAAPRSISNLEPSVLGGYQVRGVQRRVGSTDYNAMSRFFGADHKGYASFGSDTTSPPTVRIRRGNDNESSASGTVVQAAYNHGVHLPNAGFYGHFDNFLLYDSASTLHTSRNGIYPNATSGTGGALEVGDYALYMVLYLKTSEGRLALMALRQFFSFTTAGEKINIGFSATPPGTYSIDVFMSQKLPKSYLFFTGKNVEFFYGGTADASGNSSISFDDVPIGPPLALFGFGLPYVVPLSRADGLRPLATHRGRTYFVPNSDTTDAYLHYKGANDIGAPSIWGGSSYKATAKIFNQLTLAWTEQNTLNLFNYLTSYQSVSAKNSTAITGLSSTQDGLLIFCQNETFLMRGDPSFIAAGRFEDFNIQPLFPIGCDEQVRPGELGPLVFCIWKGEVYQVSAAGYENISQPVFDRTDRFTQVVGEVERNCIVCRAESGRTFYYYPDDRFWGEGPGGVKWMLPDPSVNGGTRYVTNGELGLLFFQMPRVFTGATTVTPTVTWEVDMGVKFMRKELAYVRVAVNQDFKGTMALTYRPDRGATKTVIGRRKGDEVLFPITLGSVGRIFTLTFTIQNPWTTDTVEAPLVLEYSPRDVKR
jgi:hypothetical protein